jgi:hypothetical protein
MAIAPRPAHAPAIGSSNRRAGTMPPNATSPVTVAPTATASPA